MSSIIVLYFTILTPRVSFFGGLRSCIRLGLLANYVDEIPYRQMDVNQVQAPIGLDLPADDYVTGNVINAWICRIAMHRDCQI